MDIENPVIKRNPYDESEEYDIDTDIDMYYELDVALKEFEKEKEE